MGQMIRAASLRGFGSLVRELGGDPDAYLARFGISPDVFSSDDGLIRIIEHDLMLDVAALELECPDFGLRLAVSQDLTILGPLALAIGASSTVAEALQCASRFMFVHSPALSVGVEPDPRGVRGIVALTYRKDLPDSAYSPQAMELGMGLFHHLATYLMGKLRGLRSVEIPHQPISPLARYAEFFGVDVRFGSPTAALRVEKRFLPQQFHGADEVVRQLALDHLARHYPDPGDQISLRVRRALAEGLGISPPSLPHVARLLSLHPRTLQRRLTSEGTSFEEILDGVRRDTAHRYLTTTDVPMSQVAALVGFGEQSTLTHAVRRWYGLAPRELRTRRT